MHNLALLRYLTLLHDAWSRERAAAVARDRHPLATNVPLEWTAFGNTYWLDVGASVSLPRRVVLADGSKSIVFGQTHRPPDCSSWQVTLENGVAWTRVTIYPDAARYSVPQDLRLGQLIARVAQEGDASATAAMIREALGCTGLPPQSAWVNTPTAGLTSSLSRDQAASLERLFQHRLGVLLGVPGSGKTTTLAAAALYAALNGMSVLCLAPSDDATDVLHSALCERAPLVSSPEPVRVRRGMGRAPLAINGGTVATATIAMALFRLLVDECAPDVLVIDECSMVGPATYLALATVPKRHLIIAGDPLQLPPIVQSRPDQALLGKSALHVSGATDRWVRGTPRASDAFLSVSHRLPSKVVDTIVSGWPEAHRLIAARSDWRSPCSIIPAPLVVLDTTEWLRQHPSAADGGAATHAALWATLARLIRRERTSDALSLLILSPYRQYRDQAARAAHEHVSPYGPRSLFDSRTIHQAQGMTAHVVGLDLLPLPGRSIREASFLGRERDGGAGQRALLVGLSRANVATFLAAPRWVLDASGDTAVARLIRALPRDTPRLDALAFVQQARAEPDHRPVDDCHSGIN